MAKILKTRTSPWTAVFRRAVQQLRNDPDVRRVVGLQNLRSWEGVPADKAPMTPSATAPVVRLTPQPDHVGWYSPDAQAGTLIVRVELAVMSLCIDDVVDLWDLLVAALGPGTLGAAGGTFAADLVALGAETGEIVFTDPATDPRPDAQPEGQFLAQGYFALTVLRPTC
jgi:hypothetical protein